MGLTMNLRALILSVFFVFPVCVFAHITGTYHVSGFDPLTGREYSGVAVLTENDSVYTMNWTFTSGNTDVGTGLRDHDHISFVFEELNSNRFGVQTYEIHDHHTLKGPWIRLGATENGIETLKKNCD